jgi:hypothetical protein
MTLKTEHGAFAGIWNTRYGFADWIPINGGTNGVSQHYNRMFWHSIFGESSENPTLKEIGPANQFSREENKYRLYEPNTCSIGARMNRIIYYGLTVFGDPQIYIKAPEESNPDWISPTGYNDPDDAWHDEQLAYDRKTYTKAGCTIEDHLWTWTPHLELTLSSSVDSDKIRFYAWKNKLHCKWIAVDIYYNGDWHNVYYFGYPNYKWVEAPFDEQSVEKARVRFFVKRWLHSPVTADLHEFQFHQVPQ